MRDSVQRREDDTVAAIRPTPPQAEAVAKLAIQLADLLDQRRRGTDEMERMANRLAELHDSIGKTRALMGEALAALDPEQHEPMPVDVPERARWDR